MPALVELLLGVVLVSLFLLLLPFMVPLAILQSKRDARRMRNTADTTRCLRCGSALGRNALDAAEAAWRAQLAAREASRDPTLRVRVAPRRLFAVCTACGAEHDWDEKRRIFTLLEAGQGV